MADSLTALLIDAKKEYSARLCEIVSPPLAHYMQCLYRADETVNRYISFQRQLSQIPFWNTYIIQEKTSEITRKFPYFENLMAACIVSNVKVLSSIRLSSDRPNIKLKLPGVDVFVHELYKQTAQALYYYPTLMDCGIDKLNETIFESIERAIRRLIPFDDILSSYLQGGGGESNSVQQVEDSSSSESSSSSEAKSVSSDDDANNGPINVPCDEDSDGDQAPPPQPHFPQPPPFQGVPPTVPVAPSPYLTHPIAPQPISPLPPQPAPSPVAPPPGVEPERKYPAPPPVLQPPQAVPGQLVPSTREAF